MNQAYHLPRPRWKEWIQLQGNTDPLFRFMAYSSVRCRYFVARADTAHTRQTSQLIYRSFFRPLTRVRYDVIGQDWALEQLFRVLSMHSQKLAVAPIVVLLCGAWLQFLALEAVRILVQVRAVTGRACWHGNVCLFSLCMIWLLTS